MHDPQLPSYLNPYEPSLPRGPEEFLDLSWEMFGELCRALAFRVAREYDPEMVVGIARAGVIPGAVVASILRVDFFSMKISRREGGEVVRDRPAVLSAAPREAAGKRVLIVDEITSSGETLRMALAAVRDVQPAEVRTATSFARPSGYKPDYFALETGAEIIFPWDRKILGEDGFEVNPRYEGIIRE
ncbi:MAG: phosphoribosyltransferase family protein [Longimicrobiales bacterium]|nr:phosphoribosyltransferase family protein [Longimicrobiales bacterium]